MFELAGLSTFLDIFQKAFGLIEKRKDQRRQLFEDIVEPVYTQLSVVVGEYYGFYRSCRDDFSEQNVSNWATVISEKKKKREEMVLARNKVLGLTFPFLSKHPKSKEDLILFKFAVAIQEFFYTSVDPEMPRDSNATQLVNTIEWVAALGGAGREIVLEQIEVHLRKLEHSWMKISAAYGELRVYCLS